jgi:DNA-binding response OmpR family regulator
MANILLIEPDHSLAQAYKSALESAGHSVSLSTSAQTAVDAADETCPDVVVMELQLIAHSGVEFLYEFRSYADWQQVPVIILSKVPPAEFNQCARTMREHLGVSTYCYKPQTDLKQLLHVVMNTLDSIQLKVI